LNHLSIVAVVGHQIGLFASLVDQDQDQDRKRQMVAKDFQVHLSEHYNLSYLYQDQDWALVVADLRSLPWLQQEWWDCHLVICLKEFWQLTGSVRHYRHDLLFGRQRLRIPEAHLRLPDCCLLVV
jgi:hypothetical protein